MKELNTLLTLYNNETADLKAALVTVINVEGSSYRRTGARMLIYENGIWKGGVSGGCLENDVLKKAKQVMMDQQARMVRYDTNEDSSDGIGVSLGCNGIIDILISPLKRDHPRNPFEVLKDCLQSRSSNLLITVIKNELAAEVMEGEMFRVQHGEEHEIASLFKEHKIAEEIKANINSVLKKNKTEIINFYSEKGKMLSLLFEILPPQIHLIIVGNNYDVYPMIELAHVLGWKISIIANPFKLDKSIYKLVSVFPAKKDQFPSIDVDANSAVLLMTHDYKTDLRNLSHFILSDAGYIGVLGPRTRGEKLFAELKKENIETTHAQISRVFTPAGLDIGANSPEEIALSVLAEIRTFFTGRKGGHLIEREGPIHERD